METGILIIDETEYVEQLLELVLDYGYELQGSQVIEVLEGEHEHRQFVCQIAAAGSTGRGKIAAGLLRLRELLQQEHQMVVGDHYLVVDFDEYQVKKEGEDVHLTPTEFKILSTLLQSPNRIFNREQLIAYALDNRFDGYDRSIDTYIKSIRKKIEPNRHKPRYIRTVHGVGYKFTP